MPGYQIEGFENLSENDIDRYSCSLCQNILCNPLIAQCCQQSFCEDCIKDWLKNKNNCPYCGKTLTSSQLSLPSRILLDVLGELKIHCHYKDKGCEEVLLLKHLNDHTVNCRFNVEECKKCLCEIQYKSSHDCIETLLELNRKANEELESLKDSANHTKEQLAQTYLREDSLQGEIRELKIEKENNQVLIQKFKTENEKFIKTIDEFRQQNISNPRISIRRLSSDGFIPVCNWMDVRAQRMLYERLKSGYRNYR